MYAHGAEDLRLPVGRKKTGTPFTVTVDDVEEMTAINAPEAKAIRGSFQGKLMGDSGNLVDITDGKFSTQ